MANTLRELLRDQERQKYATQAGLGMHKKLRSIKEIKDFSKVDYELVKAVESHPELSMFFCKNVKTEVPVAAIINGNFLSRRIDRMVVDNDKKEIYIMDYKTDTDKDVFRPKYVNQVQEYISIMRAIYPNYDIVGYILCLHDWTLEKV